MTVESPATGLPGKGRMRRMVECGVFVAVYVTVGVALKLDANAYLLLGIPLTVLFQYFVGRLPIRALWVGDAPPFRLGKASAVVAISLLAYPGCLFLVAPWRGDSWSTAVSSSRRPVARSAQLTRGNSCGRTPCSGSSCVS